MKSSRDKPQNHSGETRKKIKFDETDLKLLDLLLGDARMSQRALARAVGMSPPGVADRISRLESLGVITGYRVELDYALLSRPMTVIIRIETWRSVTQVDLARRLVQLPEVERVDIVTGAFDLDVRLHVRDQDHLYDVLFHKLLPASDDIKHTDTLLALETVEPDIYGKQLILSLQNELAANQDEDPA